MFLKKFILSNTFQYIKRISNFQEKHEKIVIFLKDQIKKIEFINYTRVFMILRKNIRIYQYLEI